jgi:hypothetical protein
MGRPKKELSDNMADDGEGQNGNAGEDLPDIVMSIGSNSVPVAIKLGGITPLMTMCLPFITGIIHRGTDPAAPIKQGAGSRVLKGEEPTPLEMATNYCYTRSDGTCVFPSGNVLSGLIDAGRYYKVGKVQLTTLKSSILPAALSFKEYDAPIMPQHWDIDARTIGLKNGGRIMIYRPIWFEWSLEYTLQVDTDVVSLPMARRLLDHLGNLIGIGSFRPQKKGPFGRFRVDKWEVMDVVNGAEKVA